MNILLRNKCTSSIAKKSVTAESAATAVTPFYNHFAKFTPYAFDATTATFNQNPKGIESDFIENIINDYEGEIWVSALCICVIKTAKLPKDCGQTF